MAITPFEAASFYVYNRSINNTDVSFPLHLVVFNVDDYSVGFCTCMKDGDIKIVCSTTLPGNNLCIEDINGVFCKKVKNYKSINDCVIANIKNFNQRMRLYYQSERQMNVHFDDILGIDIDCTGFEDVFKTVESKLNQLFSFLDDLWEKSKFDESEARIIIVGKTAVFYPIEYYVKSYLTFDPFLADDRFTNDTYSDAEDLIISIGEQEYNKKKNQEREIYINFLNVRGFKTQKKKLVLDPGQSDAEEIEFFGPIFVSKDAQIEFEVNSKKRMVDIPYSVEPLDSDVIEVGVCLNDDKPVIRIRRYNHPAQIYDVPVI